MRRFVLLVLLVATLVAVRPDPATACSCSPFDASQALAETEGAFIGRLTLRQKAPAASGDDAPDGIRQNPFVYRFQVDEILKGSFPAEVDLRSGEGGGDCGIEAPIGEPVGLLVDRWQGQLTSHLCAQMEPERLRRAAAPVPAEDGQPPPRLLVGTSYGGGRMLSLDGRGRIVALGGGQGLTTMIAVCPGSERVAEVSVPPESITVRDPVLAVRDLDTLALEREIPLTGLGPSDGVYREVEALTCRDAAAQDLVLFIREESPDYHSRIFRLKGSERATLWEGTATHGAFHAGGRLAYVTGGRRGTGLLAVDLTAKPVTERRLATLPQDPEALAVSSDGRAALLVRGPSSGTSNPLVIVTVDPITGDIRDVKVPDDYPSGTVVWAADGRLLFVPDEAGDAVRVYDEHLTEVAVWRGWDSSRAVVVDGRLVGLAQGIVRSAPVSGGPILRFAELGDGLPGALVSVPDAIETRPEPGGVPTPNRPAETNPDGSAVTIAALAAILVAGAAMAVYFSSRRRPETKPT